MPVNKLNTGIANDLASNVSDQVDELRGKLHLKERDGKAYYEGSEALKTSNEALIVKLRAENKYKRLAMTHSIQADKHVIKSVFQSRKEELLSMQRCTAEKAITEMDQKTCEAIKVLNELKYQRSQKESYLEQQQMILGEMLQNNTGDVDLAHEREFRRLQNDQDKSRIKYDAAKNITRRYEEVLQFMLEECHLYPSKLDLMEQMAVDARKEHAELRRMNKKATASNEESKKDLMNMEREMYQARRARDQQLNETKREVERRKELVERPEKRSKVTTLSESNVRTGKQQAMKAAKLEKILTLENAFEKIKQAINVSDINDVVFRVSNQDNTTDRLIQQKDDKLAQRAKLEEELDKLKKNFEELKFTSQRQAVKSRQLVDNMEELALTEEKQLDIALSEMSKQEKLVVDLRNGISTLFDKLKEIKLKPPYHNFSTGDLVNDLSNCERKLECLTEQINFEKSVGVTLKNANNKKLQEFLETKLPAQNMRVKLDVENISESEDFHFDPDQDNDEYISREDCKKKGQDILRTKIKPKKRKAKKGKRN
ncbi:coiled-coil domain-containing protein 183 [Patella vulgata]|uniref:coiled-coil domain-containing protein 183 n=1 Tax=Patella vulgata TaxID=6465 RepID=UPI0021808319|nr:coiled-coil domain-containing protein 183 [Patella vulgata]